MGGPVLRMLAVLISGAQVKTNATIQLRYTKIGIAKKTNVYFTVILREILHKEYIEKE